MTSLHEFYNKFQKYKYKKSSVTVTLAVGWVGRRPVMVGMVCSV